jgi:hypothetical protein
LNISAVDKDVNKLLISFLSTYQQTNNNKRKDIKKDIIIIVEGKICVHKIFRFAEFVLVLRHN